MIQLALTDWPWVFASTNLAKLAELRDAFSGTSVRLQSLAEFHNAQAIEETGKTIRENAILKAQVIAQHCQSFALADDTGLFVRALGGAPGVMTARYAGVQSSAEANRAKLLKELEGVPEQDRQAEFRCVLILVDPQGTIVAEAEGKCQGMILQSTRGESRFPYDPLFWIPEHETTLCEMDGAIRRKLNHRTVAAKKLIEFLAD